VKLEEVLAVATRLGVYVGPLRIICGQSPDDEIQSTTIQLLPNEAEDNKTTSTSTYSRTAVTIYPLYSWYHSGWDSEPAIDHPDSVAAENSVPFHRRWGDFFMCSWPTEIVSHEHFTNLHLDSRALANTFSLLNEPFLPPIPLLPVKEDAKEIETDISHPNHYPSPHAKCDINHTIERNSGDEAERDTVISFSHFVPRIELCPEKRFLMEPGLAAVIGSDVLESQIRRLSPHIHLFGHTHIPMDLELDGIRYIQWPLGYQRLGFPSYYLILPNLHHHLLLLLLEERPPCSAPWCMSTVRC